MIKKDQSVVKKGKIYVYHSQRSHKAENLFQPKLILQINDTHAFKGVETNDNQKDKKC